MKLNLRVTLLCLVGRLLGRHNLIQPNFYKTLLRFLRPEIKQIQRLLAFVAESVNENSLIDDVELVVGKISEAFLFEGMAEEKIVLALNTLRIMLLRNSNCFGKDQVNFICSFKQQKTKAIQMAARAFINAARDVVPDLLDKEFQLLVKEGQVDQRLKSEEKSKRLNGAELLEEDEKGEVEC